ncbi:hypothetical protein CPB86DRAFT_871926 [Serendipita vermifera]|nr:hypothetical protein CPB86DRAFT_871926 [Serendipita vermifera]
MSEVPANNNSQQNTKEILQKALDHRPNREELVERNILPNSNVAPSLMAAQKELERSKLEDSLNDKIKHRPTAAELVKEGILNEEEVPPS